MKAQIARLGWHGDVGPSDAAKNWTIGSTTSAVMNTTHTNAGTADEFGWTQGLAYFLDKNSNEVVPIQWSTGTVTNGFSYRNVSGAWTDASMNETVLTHGAFAYDATNNLIHALWYSTNLGDANGNTGLVYRRYVIQYSGNNISDIVSDNGVNVGGATTRTNLVVDAQGSAVPSSSSEQPSILLTPTNRLVIMWTMQNVNGVELRISMCDLSSNINAGKTAANWVNPLGGATATTSIGGAAPYVAFGKVYANAAVNQQLTYSTLHQKQTGTNGSDLCVVYTAGNSTAAYNYRWVRLRYNAGANNWSTGLSTPIQLTLIQRAGTDTGYVLKFQLLTNICEDGNGNCYVGCATWKANATGDTWGYAQITDGAEAVTLVDVYSAGGAHSYAPTGHIAYDPAKNILLASYIKTTSQFAYVQGFTGTTQKIAEQVLFTADKVDIPYFLTGNPTLLNKAPFILRNTVATFKGYSGNLTWT